MFDIDPNKSTEDLLSLIQGACIKGYNDRNLTLVIPPLSALLVKISNEASKTADKNIRIQWGMIVLTGIILCISIVQLALVILQGN